MNCWESLLSLFKRNQIKHSFWAKVIPQDPLYFSLFIIFIILMKKKIQWKDIIGFLQKKKKKKINDGKLQTIIKAFETVAKKEKIRKKVNEIMNNQQSEKSGNTLTLKPK